MGGWGTLKGGRGCKAVAMLAHVTYVRGRNRWVDLLLTMTSCWPATVGADRS